MPVCITGMHRSGTSMVAKLLSHMGLEFGPGDELLPADEFNVDGYWENRRVVELNDAILEAIGGAWDIPPAPPAGWERSPELAALRAAVADVVADLGRGTPWGWKDPRTSLTLPLWQCVASDLCVLVCVRNPFDVMLSLRRRGSMSAKLALDLWCDYNDRLVEGVGAGTYVVTHYEDYFADAAGELRRVATRLGLPVDDAELQSAVAGVRADLRHHSGVNRIDPNLLPARARELYRRLREPLPGAAQAPSLHGAALADLRPVALASIVAAREEAAAYRDDRDAWRLEADRRQAAADALSSELADLRRQLSESEEAVVGQAGSSEALLQLRLQYESVVHDRDTQAAEGIRLRSELDSVREELRSAERELKTSTAESAAALVSNIRRIETAMADAESVGEEARAHERQLAHAREELATLRLERAEAVAAKQSLAGELAVLRKELAEIRAVAEEREGRLGQLASELDDRTRSFSVSEASLLGKLSARETELAGRAGELVAVRQQLEDAREELVKVTTDSARRRDEVQQELEVSRRRLLAVEQRTVKLQGKLERRRLNAGERERRIRELRDGLLQEQARVTSLEEALRQERKRLKRSQRWTRRLSTRLADTRREQQTQEAASEDASSSAPGVTTTGDEREEQASAAHATVISELSLVSKKLEMALTDRDRAREDLAVEQVARASYEDALMRLYGTTRRRRFISQLGSWLILPTPRRIGNVFRYLAIRRSLDFDPSAYLRANVDVLAAGLDAHLHYAEHGVREGRPLSLPPSAATVTEAPEANAVGRPQPGRAGKASQRSSDGLGSEATLARLVEAVHVSGLFDDAYYRASYPDVDRGDSSPIVHFAAHGWSEKRNPNAYFDTAWYVDRYPIGIRTTDNPLVDYILNEPRRQPSILFDPQFYAQNYALPLGASGALADYLSRARKGEWRNPIAGLDVARYLSENPDVKEAGVDPVIHYFEVGRYERRATGASDSTSRIDRPPPVALAHDASLNGSDLGHSDAGASRVDIASEIRTSVSRGDEFEEFNPGLSRRPVSAKAIAFYLPQFHPIPENDEWWGTGFTEWHNVARGCPRYVGHYQPRVPRDLGFYNLEDRSTMRRQVDLARAAGLHGFAFYYYWFNGKRLLERPLNAFLEDPSLDFPFCIMWANENWTRRWDGHDEEILIAQDYRPEDDVDLVDDMQQHFADPRYIRLDGRPLLIIYRLDTLPRPKRTIQRWRQLWSERHGEEPVILVAQGFGVTDPRRFGADGAVEFPPHKLVAPLRPITSDLEILDPAFNGDVFAYADVVTASLEERYPDFPLAKTAVPGWDNDARRQGGGLTLHGSSPAAYERWLQNLVEVARRHPVFGEPLVFINAWNEWAEAAYLEPDVRYGAAYLNATARALAAPADSARSKRKILLVGHDAHRHGAQFIALNIGDVFRNQFGCEVSFLLLEGGALLEDYAAVGRVCVAENQKAAEEFIRTLSREGYELALVNTAVSGRIVPCLKARGYRVATLIHEMPGLISEYQLESAVESACVDSDVVVVPSEVVGDHLRASFPSAHAAQVCVRPQGFYRSQAVPTDARLLIRKRLGIPDDALIVLNVGYGDFRKGIDLFAGVAEAARRNEDLHFVWVGAIDPRIESQLGVGRNDHLHYVPFSDDILTFYAAANAFFLTSREDPFPSVVLEALSVGLPVIAFAGATGSEAILESYGVVVEPGSPEAALAAVMKAVRDDDESARDRRRRLIDEKFRYDDYAFDLLRLLIPDLKKVSVLVPNFNYGQHLGDRLETIFEQTYPVFETLVLDDASSDDSLERLDAIRASTGRRFVVAANERNSGSPFRQWSRGATRARGDVLWIAEADDSCSPRFLEELVGCFGRGDIAYAFSDSMPIDAEGRSLGDSYKWYYRQAEANLMEHDFVVDGETFVRKCLTERNLILNVSAVLWDRATLLEALESCGRQLDTYALTGDWYLYAIAALRGREVAYVAEALNVHRRHGQSVTGRLDPGRHVDEVLRVHEALHALLQGDEGMRQRMRSYQSQLEAQFGLAPNGA